MRRFAGVSESRLAGTNGSPQPKSRGFSRDLFPSALHKGIPRVVSADGVLTRISDLPDVESQNAQGWLRRVRIGLLVISSWLLAEPNWLRANS